MLVIFIVVMANTLTAARLICFQRHGARYRFSMSLLAYLLIVCAGGQVIDVLVNHDPVSVWDAGFSAAIAVLVWRARGNVACMMRALS